MVKFIISEGICHFMNVTWIIIFSKRRVKKLIKCKEYTILKMGMHSVPVYETKAKEWIF